MKVHNLEQRSEEWFQIRRGKITGSEVKRILGTKLVRDAYFYELLADRLSNGSGEDESDMNRGVRLEDEAVAVFEKQTGKIVDRVGFCESDSHPCIASSPDGLIESNGKYHEAVETKCLSSAKHVRAWLENKIPDEHYAQVVQYFIVNDDLYTLYFVLYDPRISVHPMHIITVERDELREDIEEYKQAELDFIDIVEDKLQEIIKI